MFFKSAKPIWVNGREKELNLSLCFISKKLTAGSYNLKVTASCLYMAKIDGEFFGYGPARCAHGYFRVDEYDFTVRYNSQIEICVAGYNTKSFYTLNQSSFLQAEITDKTGKVVCATGENEDFTCYETKRLSRVLRFSYQRPFTEYYSENKPCKKQETSVVKGGKLLPRQVDYPSYKDKVAKVVETGSFTENPKNAQMEINRINSTPTLKIFNLSELERNPVPKINSLKYSPYDLIKTDINAGEYAVYKFDKCQTGFIGLDISVTEQTELHIIFDEIDFQEKGGQKGIIVDYTRNDCYNMVSYELAPNTHQLLSFEPYTVGYMKIIVIKGKTVIRKAYVKAYEHPFFENFRYENQDKKIEEIVMSAGRSFAHNAVDLLFDCPSRERAGWLCDGYFSARAERFFTGESKVERNFLENYALYSGVENIPDGMVPMCYPADFEKQEFIPNWAMWYALQLKEYYLRTGDKNIINLSERNINGLLKYFLRFENEYGLLENLENWVFVEWSKANDFTNGVNYPSNMLYAKMLDDIADLYNHPELKLKAQKIRQTVREMSFNGKFFVDNAVRVGGKLTNTENITETCQYYAFYFGVSNLSTHSELFSTLIQEFGPNRNIQKTYPQVHPSNTFMGNYMRLEILLKENFYEKVLSESVDYFYKMAVRTGTLWEHDSVTAKTLSLDHGFTSFIACIISKASKNQQKNQ